MNSSNRSSFFYPSLPNEPRFLPAPTRSSHPAAQTPSSGCRNRSESWPRTAPRIPGAAIPLVVLAAVGIEAEIEAGIEAVGAETGAAIGIETVEAETVEAEIGAEAGVS